MRALCLPLYLPCISLSQAKRALSMMDGRAVSYDAYISLNLPWG
jgi:hypothetical protein